MAGRDDIASIAAGDLSLIRRASLGNPLQFDIVSVRPMSGPAANIIYFDAIYGERPCYDAHEPLELA